MLDTKNRVTVNIYPVEDWYSAMVWLLSGGRGSKIHLHFTISMNDMEYDLSPDGVRVNIKAGTPTVSVTLPVSSDTFIAMLERIKLCVIHHNSVRLRDLWLCRKNEPSINTCTGFVEYVLFGDLQCAYNTMLLYTRIKNYQNELIDSHE